MKKTLLRIGLGLLALVLLAGIGFVVWASNPLGPGEIAVNMLQSSDSVQVERTRYGYAFIPNEAPASTALIFYPGGRVDYRSYAPPLEMIAAQGYPVYLVEMPLSLAVFGINRAEAVMAAQPEIEHWAIGGHSLGGAMAAAFVYNHPGEMQGLVFWAAYPAENNSLADRNVQVVSVSAGLDGLATPEKIQASKPLLPPDTTWVVIPGGIHAHFGDYGAQPGDGQAEIPASSQWNQAADATVELLQKIGGGEMKLWEGAQDHIGVMK